MVCRGPPPPLPVILFKKNSQNKMTVIGVQSSLKMISRVSKNIAFSPKKNFICLFTTSSFYNTNEERLKNLYKINVNKIFIYFSFRNI